MNDQQRPAPIHAGQVLARFHRFARTMVVTATDHGGTMLELIAYEPGGQDRPIAVFERTDGSTLVEEWSLGAYLLGLQQGSKSRATVMHAVTATVGAIFNGEAIDPESGIELLYPAFEPPSKAAA